MSGVRATLRSRRPRVSAEVETALLGVRRHAVALTGVVVFGAAGALPAQAFPLPASAGDRTSLESTAPFLVPLRTTQTKLADRAALAPQGIPTAFNHWDMIAFDPAGSTVFVTAEQTTGAGLFRYELATGTATLLMQGDGSGNRRTNPHGWRATRDDFSNLDACLFTPWHTVLVAEEAPGGRVFEVLDPFNGAGAVNVVWRHRIPAATFEGIRIDSAGVLYFSDEDHSGSIYKFVPAAPGDLAAGQTFVLSADAYAADPNARPDENWSAPANRPIARFGLATWVPMTDAVGNALTEADPFDFVTTTGGRTAADELGATPYGRCEDMDIGVLANGNEVIYVTLTGENRVIAVELLGPTTAFVHVFVDFDTVDLATGVDVNPLQNDPYSGPGPGTTFNDPDNLAVDAFGSVYILEDHDPGDIWKAFDRDRDGVAEAIGLFASLGVSGSEPSGMIFDPAAPYRCLCNVLGPSSGNTAMWAFDTRPFAGNDRGLEQLVGVDAWTSTGPGEFARAVAGGHLAMVQVRGSEPSLTGSVFGTFVQAFATASQPVPWAPAVWLDPFGPIALLAGLPLQLPADGVASSIPIPPGFQGYSVMVQSAADVGGTLAFSDAHEFVIN